jgi:hypothetical protein
MAEKIGATLDTIDRASAQAAEVVAKRAKAALGERNVELAASLNAKAEGACAAGFARGMTFFRLFGMLVEAFAGALAKFSIVVFFFSLLGFCLAAGLLAYTEQNADPVLGFGCVGAEERSRAAAAAAAAALLCWCLRRPRLLSPASPPPPPPLPSHLCTPPTTVSPAHTAWRRAVTSIVIVASLLSFHSIFLRYHILMQSMGSLIWYSAVVTFIILTFDAEAVEVYCRGAFCNINNTTANGLPTHLDPLTPGNLAPAPGLDFVCLLFWGISGLALSKRGRIIQEEIKEAEQKAANYQEMANTTASAQAAGAPSGDVEAQPVAESS